MADHVDRDGNSIRLVGRLTARTALWVIGEIREAVERGGRRDLTLDFRGCERSWADGMAPLICHAALLRKETGCSFDLRLPEDESMRRVFAQANWPHLLSPERFDPSDSRSQTHLPATWYDATTHNEIVNQIVEIVVQSMEIERPVMAGLEWSINEITDNVLNHADAPLPGLVQVVTQRDHHRIHFVVADAGRGILSSMLEGFPSLRDDEEAIGEAIKQGVTRDSDAGQGNGLAGTLRVAVQSNGSFSILSGKALMSIYRDPGSGEYGDHIARLPDKERYQGTVVTGEFDSSAPLRLEDALGFKPGWESFDYIDARYTSPDGRSLEIRLKEETTGFGSRTAGKQVRNKCLNLLRGDPTLPLILDWEGVPLISSSFADEAIGKLFAELGPLTFGSRVHNTNLEPLVGSLIERAIVQRMSQSAAS
jgi:hypothetical protein